METTKQLPLVADPIVLFVDLVLAGILLHLHYMLTTNRQRKFREFIDASSCRE